MKHHSRYFKLSRDVTVQPEQPHSLTVQFFRFIRFAVGHKHTRVGDFCSDFLFAVYRYGIYAAFLHFRYDIAELVVEESQHHKLASDAKTFVL